MEMWTGLVRDIGLPAVLLLALARGLWVGGRWVGEKVLLPLTTRHIVLIEQVAATLLSVRRDFRRMARSQARFTRAHAELAERLCRDLDARGRPGCVSPPSSP